MNMGAKMPKRKGFADTPTRAILVQKIDKEIRSMNAPRDLSMKTDEVLRVELEVFKQEHRDLDDAITALVERGTGDQLTIQRLKKQKLRLKDIIALIEDRLTPDIIA